MTSMVNEQEVLKIVVERLGTNGIHYMITGSIAANFYTTPRMTRDIDIIVEAQESDTEKLFSLFSDDFYVDRDSVVNAVHTKTMYNIIHREGIVKVDFIIRKDAEYRKVEFERRRRILFEGVVVDVVSPEDLVLSKLYWAKDTFSEMQIKDVKNLLRTVSNLDREYIETWVARLDLEKIYQRVER